MHLSAGGQPMAKVKIIGYIGYKSNNIGNRMFQDRYLKMGGRGFKFQHAQN